MSLEVNIKKKLKGFNLDLEFMNTEGKLGILGASGCGKSMTLKCIAGVVTPDSGRIVLNGHVLFDSSRKIDLRPQQRKVGYLFQNYALFPHLTVNENIACGLGLTKEAARRNPEVRRMIGLMHMDGLEERYPGELSGGQQQRVALARILVCRPEILLLDEPFAALDEYLKEKLQLELAELMRGYGSNVVLVTHNRDEVYKFCDRMLAMDNGRIIEQGGTAALFSNPKRVQTARLTGCKNISAARKRGEYEVEALDWGVCFAAAEPVSDTITSVGIRAHSFYPAKAGEPNAMAVTVTDRNDSPFEHNVIFQASGQEKLWWKLPRGAALEAPSYLAVSPENVLLLED
ncbi:Fe(3+) ions import ATP-binding protein FbpC [bioreactor metagenome]|uniref:Fe(3+) ions import ATP-binding protein FbpC n=1 Tax=bioreactor metagenome TaxID=1076179 RepID=A0A644X297_9ZZZZ